MPYQINAQEDQLDSKLNQFRPPYKLRNGQVKGRNAYAFNEYVSRTSMGVSRIDPHVAPPNMLPSSKVKVNSNDYALNVKRRGSYTCSFACERRDTAPRIT
jgi:hypothetical protein